MPEILTAPESQLSTLTRFQDIAPDVQKALEEISQRAENDILVAYIEAYRSRLNALVNETTRLLGWIEPERPAPVAAPILAPKKPEIDPALARRAKLAAGRLRQRQEVAELRANMQANRDAGFPTDASERDLDRMRDERVRLFGDDNYVFGLAKTHSLTAAGWRELADAYRALANEAQSWTRKPVVEAKDAERIDALKARFDLAIAPCGHDLNHDADVDWLATLRPAPVPEPSEPRPDDLATVDTIRQAIGAAGRPVQAATLAPTGPTPADRCRLKAGVARAKGRIARAEARGGRDEDAALELARLQTRHRVEFRMDGYVFGFSSAHRLEPDAWEELARAYDDLAEALDRGVDSAADARRAQEAVARFGATIAPIGRALRHDEDADDLQDEIREVHPRLGEESADALAPFLPLALPEDAAGVTALAETILSAGVRPSDPRLREPFIEWVEDLDGPLVEPLVRELRLEIDRRQAVEAEEEAAAPDPAYLAMRDRVREVTRGKRLLMVGGLNREETRRAIVAEMELESLHWPSSDEHKTKPTAFDPHVDHADIVLKNRFCRRGYQRALTLAREQGKPAVALTGGYSPRQVVRCVAEALRL